MSQAKEKTTGSDRGAVLRVVALHPLATFVVLAYILSWWAVPLLGFPLGSGPFFAAVVVLSLTEGRKGIFSLFRRMIHWRIGARWYVIAILLPAGAAVVAAAVTFAMGAPAPSDAVVGDWIYIVPFFFVVLLVPVLGPWEEPGFRGFALDQLTRTWSPLVAGLLVGVIHVVWHLPIFLKGDIPASDVVQILAASIVFAWLVVSTGSILIAMVMHATSNAVSGNYLSYFFEGGDAVVNGWIRALMWCLFAAVVVLVAGRSFRTRETAEPTAPPATA